MVLAGAGEGAVLGLAQGSVVRRQLPGLSSRDWTARTSAAAAVAWALGMAPSSLGDTVQRWSPAVQVIVMAPAAVALLLAIGAAQWTVLRRHVAGAAAWIGWTALGWLAGLGLFLAVATPLWRPGQGVALVAGIGVLAGFLMAVTMAAVTGWGLLRLLRPRSGTARSFPF
jgi:Ca2+-transporting ATPase